MGELELERLQLSAEQVLSATDFYEAYGNFCLAELGGLPPDFQDLRIASSTWTEVVDAASAFRQAGQWAMLVPLSARHLNE
jgi:hypothetical protein